MLKPIIILVAIGAIGLVGYKVFAQKDEPTQINETVLLIIVKLLYYSYKIRKKLEITHRLSRSTILYA
ncbi:hypothetical protein ACLD0Y_02435, partial [Acinetobacter baumannii]